MLYLYWLRVFLNWDVLDLASKFDANESFSLNGRPYECLFLISIVFKVFLSGFYYKIFKVLNFLVLFEVVDFVSSGCET